MDFSTVATLAGAKAHLSTDGKRTLCGREVSNATSGLDMCKACVKAADKLTDAAPVEPSPAVGALADAVAVAMPVLVPVPLILTRTPIAVVGNAPGGPNHLYGTSKGDGTGPTVADIMTRAERQGATNLRAYASDTCPEITGHYDTFRPVCVNHPNAEGAWWGKINDRPVYFCEACNNVPVSDRPEAVERESRLREAMPLFNAMVGTRRTDSRGYVYVVDNVKFTPVRHRYAATVSVSGTVVEEYSDAADGPDRARTYGAYAGELFYGMPERETFDYATPAAPIRADWETDGSANREPHHYCPNCTQSHPTEDVELHAAPCFVCASDGHAGCQHADDAPTLADMTHMIQFTGDDVSLCGIMVKSPMRPGFTIRVSVDPSDATCADCIAQEATLAALDAVQPDDDAQDHQAAILDALTAAESHLTAPVLRLTPAPDGSVVASVDGHARKFRAHLSNRPAIAMWAHQHGVRPATGRAFRWAPDGDTGTLTAPARRF